MSWLTLSWDVSTECMGLSALLNCGNMKKQQDTLAGPALVATMLVGVTKLLSLCGNCCYT